MTPGGADRARAPRPRGASWGRAEAPPPPPFPALRDRPARHSRLGAGPSHPRLLLADWLQPSAARRGLAALFPGSCCGPPPHLSPPSSRRPSGDWPPSLLLRLVGRGERRYDWRGEAGGGASGGWARGAAAAARGAAGEGGPGRSWAWGPGRSWYSGAAPPGLGSPGRLRPPREAGGIGGARCSPAAAAPLLGRWELGPVPAGPGLRQAQA